MFSVTAGQNKRVRNGHV